MDTTSQANKDRGGFSTTPEDVFKGKVKAYDEGGTQEVGNCYSLDPLGKEKVSHVKPK